MSCLGIVLIDAGGEATSAFAVTSGEAAPEMLITDPTIPRRDRELLSRYAPLLTPACRRPAGFAGRYDSALDRLVGSLHGTPGLVFLAEPVTSLVDTFVTHSYRVARLTRAYHGRYVTGADLDGEARALVSRAQAAARAVVQSRVNRSDMLDAMANDVVLPQQIWEIAWLAHSQTILRSRQRSVSTADMTPELAAVIGPQRRALERSVAGVARRIEVLEEYAARVKAADSALLAQRLLADNHKYRELLAHTDDEQAISELTERSRHIEATLRDNVLAAVQAGQALALPPDTDSPLETDPGPRDRDAG